MNTLGTVAVTLVAVAVAAGVAYGGYAVTHSADSYAAVVDVKPSIKTWSEPVQECHDVTVRKQAPATDNHQIAGTVIGAVIGGVIGHQFGGGHGKDAATAAGAIAGGYAGNKTQEHMQAGDTYTTTEQRCGTVSKSHSKQDGYKVTYEYQGQRHTVHMDDKPGDRLPVKDGHVVTD